MASLCCTQHPDQPAAVIIGIVDTGDQLILCGECMAGWVAGVWQALQAAAPEAGEGPPEPPQGPADELPAPKGPRPRSKGATGHQEAHEPTPGE